MSCEFIECEQNSDEWYRARMGVPTASCFAAIMTKGKKKGADSKIRREYMLKLAGEILTDDLSDSYSGYQVRRGKQLEPEARELYALLRNVEPQLVGFVRNGLVGCSPDALIGDDGGAEFKAKLPHLQIECLDLGVLPAEHHAQVQGNMWVTERSWWDFVSYCPKLPLFVIRVERDEQFIEQLRIETAKFIHELNTLVEKIRNYGRRTTDDA